MKLGRKILSIGLALTLSTSVLMGSFPASATSGALDSNSDFYNELVNNYTDPDIEYQTEVRWWMGMGAHTDETLKEEVQAMYDAGFRGLELCEQSDSTVSATDYGYGSDQWFHDMKLVMNMALDLGMTVSLTSGTNWATANIPGLDPDSQSAGQSVFETDEKLEAGASRSGLVPTQKVSQGGWGGSSTVDLKEVNKFIGAYAYKQVGEGTNPITFAPEAIDLTDQIVKNEDGTLSLDWTAPNDGTYYIFYYWQQGTYQTASPAIEPSYCINYFDESGVEALKEYWEEHILNDEALNAKIREGDVQLFMDSLEIETGDGFTFWSDDMAEEFMARKGYDIRPYLYLFIGLPNLWSFNHAEYGTYDISENADLRDRVQNDLFDVQTELYMERMLTPIKEWLNEYGIKIRGQISYGQYLEISEPIMGVDYPEAENLNQYNQVDIYRLWSGGAHLQNKVLSSETGAVGGYQYGYTYQDHLMEAYSLFSAGFSRIIWHVWSSQYGPGTPNWPGYNVAGFMGNLFYTFGTREPSSSDYGEFNNHLGRVQQLMREGKSRTDVGMIYMKYDQGMPTSANSNGVNWMLNHEPVLFPSTELQDNGYTYDYFSPSFLTADGVEYDASTQTLEQAGYKALVLWQDWLALDGAQEILNLAKQGLKVVVVDGAAVQTPYNDGNDEALAEVMSELKSLPTVKSVASADDVYEALQEFEIEPYAGFEEANHQLLTQVRQDGDDRYLYLYNYCDGSYKSFWSDGAEQDDHGDSITTDIVMDGIFIPYYIDAWSGEVVQIADYRYENGKTIFSISLDYNDVGLYAFEAVDETADNLHVVSTGMDSAYIDGNNIVVRGTESGTYYTELSDGSATAHTIDVPQPYDITNWDVTVESWTPSEERDSRTETLFGKTITETSVKTDKTEIAVTLDKLTTWDNIPEVGKNVSGKADYQATFNWDGTADGAYLDFGDMDESMQVYINGEKTADLNMNDPILDISDYLVIGENSIELKYSSNLTNVQLARGAKSESENVSGWYGYNLVYHSYGPSQATVIPYVEEEIALPESQPVLSASAPESVQVNSPFVVSVVTAGSIEDVRLYNENDMAIGCKGVEVINNEDETKIFHLTISVGTVGDGRTFKVVAKGAEGYYKDSGVTVSVDITSVLPVLTSFDLPDSAVANRTFIVKATTDLNATGLAVYNENGMKMGIKSLSYEVIDGYKMWTGVMSIGTKGDRTFSAYAVNKYGAKSEALADSISVKAFA